MENVSQQRFSFVTERFCSNLGDNAIILTQREGSVVKEKCLSKDRCTHEECKHKANDRNLNGL